MDGFLDSITHQQLAEWRAYLTIIGSEEWEQTATVAQQINAIGAGVSGGKPEPFANFIPLLKEVANDESDPISNLEKSLAARMRV